MHFKKLYLLLILLLTGGNLSIQCQGTTDFNAIFNQFKDSSSEELNRKGYDLFSRNELDSALVCYTIITNRYVDNMSKDDKRRCAHAHNTIGSIYFLYTEYTKAYTNFLKGMEICEEIGDNDLINYIYTNIANVYSYYGDKTRAEEYYKKSYRQSILTENWRNLMVTLYNMISLSFPDGDLRNIEKELHEFESLEIPEDDLYLYTRAIVEGALDILAQNYREAIFHFEESFNYTSDLAYLSKRYAFSSHTLIAETYALMRQYDLAVSYMEKGGFIVLESNNLDLLSGNYKALSKFYQQMGDEATSLDYKYRYLHIHDSIFNAKEFGKIKDMQSLYEVEKIATRVHQLTVQQKLKDRILFIVSFGTAIILLLLLFAYRQNKRLNERNKDLFRKNVEAMRSEESEKQIRKGYEERLKEYEERLHEEKQMPSPLDENEEEQRYKSSNLSDEYKAFLLEKIRQVMDNTMEFCSEDFSIERLATMVNSKSKYVSQVINEGLGKNFSAFLNEYRISEARKRLMDIDTYGNLTIEGIASDLGFKSRGSFYQNFKRITGLTPAEYQKLARKENILSS